MSERSVLSSFRSASEARKAAELIKQLGVEVAQIDELHAFGGYHHDRESYLISGQIPSLASATLNVDPSSKDASVMLAADPSASGMADQTDQMAEHNFLLTVVCPSELVEQVVQIIKSSGGYT